MNRLNIFRFFILSFCVVFLYTCVPIDQQGQSSNSSNSSGGTAVKSSKTMVPQDMNYEPNIRTVLLYPNNGVKTDVINPPIVPLQQTVPLYLEFDELGNKMTSYYVKIINCYANWEFSPLNSIQYLSEYNEYLIADRNASYNTRIPYIHYKFVMPRLKLSGNYIVVVYRDRNETDFVLTKRFVVYESLINIMPQAKFSVVTPERSYSQQIDFVINYSNYPLINPVASLNLVLRQNHRWDNAIRNLKPSFVQEDIQQLDYYFYEGQNTFKGVNEFRYFDARSNRFKGMNVAKVQLDADKSDIYLIEDKNRSAEPYALFQDIDGKFTPENYETGGREVEPDYVFVNFTLNSIQLDGKVYVLGPFNDYKVDKNVEMTYDETLKKYTAKIIMKQGYYNYRYAYLPPNSNKLDETYFEGSFSITQNLYDIIAYYRPFGKISDQVVGYTSINYNRSR